MKVMVGSTFGIEVAAASAVYARDQPTEKKISSSCLFLKEDDVGGGSDRGSRDASSDSSSSIGSPGDSDDEEEEGVVSSGGSGGLSAVGSMEESLPIKRGLSNYYAGKSKSFGNLSDVSSVKEVKELQKAENPFNKKRRLLLANRWSRKSSFYSWQNPNSMPLFALIEDDEDAENKETPSSSSSPSESSSTSSSNDKRVSAVAANKSKLHQCNLKASFKSQSCFSLTDLEVERQ